MEDFRSRRGLEKLFELSLDLLCVAGFDGYFKLLNPAWSDLLGYTLEELCAKPWLHFVHPDDHDKTNAEYARVRAGEKTYKFQNRYTAKNGSVHWLEWSATIADGEPLFYCVARDVTDKKRAEEALSDTEARCRAIAEQRERLEEQLFRAQKLDALGRLAGGVAHDFNNLLSAILGFTELALDQAHEPGLRGDLEDVQKAASRAADLVRQLLAFSRQQSLSPRVLDLNLVVRDLSNILARLVGENVELELALDDAIGNVSGDPVQLSQVVINLAANARDAMPEGGRLKIATRSVRLEHGHPDLTGVAPAGDYVILEVTDSGVGMSEEVRARIFEPFYTTKPHGRGTGLGLATVYGIVTQSRGFIHVASTPGHGASFRVFLPQSEHRADALEAVQGAPGVAGMLHTVLVAEDEEMVRSLAERALTRSGYRVLTARDGLEALRMIEDTGSIDVLVTDLVMPVMGGAELLRRLDQNRIEVKTIVMSGYSTDGPPAGAIEFLSKPFTGGDLVRKVQAVLGS